MAFYQKRLKQSDVVSLLPPYITGAMSRANVAYNHADNGRNRAINAQSRADAAYALAGAGFDPAKRTRYWSGSSLSVGMLAAGSGFYSVLASGGNRVFIHYIAGVGAIAYGGRVGGDNYHILISSVGNMRCYLGSSQITIREVHRVG